MIPLVLDCFNRILYLFPWTGPGGSGPLPLFPPGVPPPAPGSGGRGATSTPTSEASQGGTATPPNGPGGVRKKDKEGKIPE